jgi:adenine/guanine phosphoribosyltransferase-like PRPP-binding protein
MRTQLPDIASGYLSYLLDPIRLQKIVRNATKHSPTTKYDTIAFRGMSGALVAPPIAGKLKKNLIMVRKDIKNCHSCQLVEGYKKSKNYIIVDDFVESGRTAFDIYYAVKKFSPKSKCLGVLVAADGAMGKHAEFITFSALKRNYSYGWRNATRHANANKSKSIFCRPKKSTKKAKSSF